MRSSRGSKRSPPPNIEEEGYIDVSSSGGGDLFSRTSALKIGTGERAWSDWLDGRSSCAAQLGSCCTTRLPPCSSLQMAVIQGKICYRRCSSFMMKKSISWILD